MRIWVNRLRAAELPRRLCIDQDRALRIPQREVDQVDYVDFILPPRVALAGSPWRNRQSDAPRGLNRPKEEKSPIAATRLQ